MFKDLYIIKWLIQNTKEANSKILWQRKETGGYFALINEGKDLVKIEIVKVQARPCARIVIKLSSRGQGEIELQEPLQKILSLRKAYYSEEEAELAKNMTELLATIVRQNAQKYLHDIETEEERKQRIFQRLISGDAQNT